MQDIIPPQKPKRKNKIFLFTIIILLMGVVSIVTFFLTKYYYRCNLENEVKSSEEVIKEPKGESSDYVYVTSRFGLNMREEANTSSDIIYTMPYGAKIEIENKAKDDKWYKGTFNDKTGWFSADYVSKEEPEDLTLSWQNFDSQSYNYSLKYPEEWRIKNPLDPGYDIQITKKSGSNWISVQVKDSTIEKEKETLTDEDHVIASQSVIFIDNVKGIKYTIQKMKDSRVTYTSDIILLEKDGKLLRLDGPADGESDGDTFNLLMWTVKFK